MGADLPRSRKAKGFASHLQGDIQDWRWESRPLWAAKSSPLPNFETRSRFFLQNAILGADCILSLRKRNNSWLSFWVFLLLLLHRENLLGVFSVLFPAVSVHSSPVPWSHWLDQWRTFFFSQGNKILTSLNSFFCCYCSVNSDGKLPRVLVSWKLVHIGIYIWSHFLW